MGVCRFDLSRMFVNKSESYKIIGLGDKYAKLRSVDTTDEGYIFRLESIHKKEDFRMIIETMWSLKYNTKTFVVIHCIVEIEVFGACFEVMVVPKSHINTLTRWYERNM